MKQGGSVKTWKSRWFVVSDTNLYYYKDKKDWENGPVKGNPAPPKGAIEFSEVIRVTTHMDFLCELVETKPKKVEKTYCLHVHTKNRIYNILGFETKELAEKWLQTLAFSVKSHHLKKEAKRYLTTRTDMKQSGTVDGVTTSALSSSGRKEEGELEFTPRPPPKKQVRFNVPKELADKVHKKMPKDMTNKARVNRDDTDENDDAATDSSEQEGATAVADGSADEADASIPISEQSES